MMPALWGFKVYWQDYDANFEPYPKVGGVRMDRFVFCWDGRFEDVRDVFV